MGPKTGGALVAATRALSTFWKTHSIVRGLPRGCHLAQKSLLSLEVHQVCTIGLWLSKVKSMSCKLNWRLLRKEVLKSGHCRKKLKMANAALVRDKRLLRDLLAREVGTE